MKSTVISLNILFSIYCVLYYTVSLHTYFIVTIFLMILIILMIWFGLNNYYRKMKKQASLVFLKDFNFDKKLNIYKVSRTDFTAFIGYTKNNIDIYIGKRLLSEFSNNELKVIIYHELGHYKHRHINSLRKGIVYLLFISLPLTYYYGISTFHILIVYIACFIHLMFVVGVYNLSNKYIELLADKYSVCKTSRNTFIKTLIKAAKAYKKPLRIKNLYSSFFLQHPSIAYRYLYVKKNTKS